jgi:hypothetical protein
MLMTVIDNEMAIESMELEYFICSKVSPYTIPNEAPSSNKVTKYVNNFLSRIEQSGIPIFSQMMSSGYGARNVLTSRWLKK